MKTPSFEEAESAWLKVIDIMAHDRDAPGSVREILDAYFSPPPARDLYDERHIEEARALIGKQVEGYRGGEWIKGKLSNCCGLAPVYQLVGSGWFPIIRTIPLTRITVAELRAKAEADGFEVVE